MIFTTFLLFFVSSVSTVQTDTVKWKEIVNRDEGTWFASEEAIQIAENVLLYQRNLGGWPKNIQMHKPLSNDQKSEVINLKSSTIGITIDNGATTMEMLFLSKIYRQTLDQRYKEAFLRGLTYILNSQYENGGFPQFYPNAKGYAQHITFNDNAMINALNLLKHCLESKGFYSIELPIELVDNVRVAYIRGIDCILKTQYIQKGVLTSWCAQHDMETFEPTKARSYELPSLSGSESAEIVLFLISIENPSNEIILAIDSAVEWFKKVKITGLREIRTYSSDGNLLEKEMVLDSTASYIWARFMDLEDNTPFFCGRDGVKKYSITEIPKERRNGYRWYTDAPQKVIEEYEKWKELN